MDPGRPGPARPDPHLRSCGRVRVQEVKNDGSRAGSGSRGKKMTVLGPGPGPEDEKLGNFCGSGSEKLGPSATLLHI